MQHGWAAHEWHLRMLEAANLNLLNTACGAEPGGGAVLADQVPARVALFGLLLPQEAGSRAGPLRLFCPGLPVQARPVPLLPVRVRPPGFAISGAGGGVVHNMLGWTVGHS